MNWKYYLEVEKKFSFSKTYNPDTYLDLIGLDEGSVFVCESYYQGAAPTYFIIRPNGKIDSVTFEEYHTSGLKPLKEIPKIRVDYNKVNMYNELFYISEKIRRGICDFLRAKLGDFDFILTYIGRYIPASDSGMGLMMFKDGYDKRDRLAIFEYNGGKEVKSDSKDFWALTDLELIDNFGQPTGIIRASDLETERYYIAFNGSPNQVVRFKVTSKAKKKLYNLFQGI